MKKLLRNKRMFLTLIAGMLVFIAVLGAGTFAWFTGQDYVTVQTEIKTATVAVDADEALTVQVLSWHPSTMMGLNYHTLIEDTYDTPTQHDEFVKLMFDLYCFGDPAFIHSTSALNPYPVCGWDLEAYSNYVRASGSPLYDPAYPGLVYVADRIDEVPAPYIMPPWINDPYPVVFIKNALTTNSQLANNEIANVTPGDLIVASYGFNVKEDGNGDPLSSIPVYFRLQAPKLTVVDDQGNPVTVTDPVTGNNVAVELETESMMRVMITGTLIDPDAFIAASEPYLHPVIVPPTLPPIEATLVLVGDYYYCDLPLSPIYAWKVEAKFDTYIYGINGNEFQDKIIKFINPDPAAPDPDRLYVDVIQATNNAVYFADEWKDAAALDNPKYNPDLDPAITALYHQFFIDYTDEVIYTTLPGGAAGSGPILEFGMYAAYRDYLQQ